MVRRFARHLLTPDASETNPSKRGFHVKSPESREVLERVGRTFLMGFGEAVEVGESQELPARLAQVSPRFRGFAYEGAGMGFAMVDALTFARGRRVREYLRGCGDPHVYMVYIGLGWAMARLPRARWPRLPLDPLLQWFVLDGFGFHQAYFRTERYVRRHHRDSSFPRPPHDPHGYAYRALDQGIGRALWFVGGAAPEVVAELIEGFPPERRSDLYSGAGLAATYAGGADEFELRDFWKRAGDHRPYVAQGSAFAAEARHRAGLETPHTEMATRVFCDMAPAQAVQVCAGAGAELDRPGLANAAAASGTAEDEGRGLLYEEWRRRIAEEFASRGRC
ncbi:DUF1702 family protein [Actinomadura nitritigenes]|uniref:DUF1702 family protein n=1 Tax=Actinomadura nitritigenes TaxID=134602 RepID=UPI003D94EA13